MILIPVLGRPHRVKPVLRSIAGTVSVPHRVLFICDPGDREQQHAIAMAGGWMISPGGGYAAKIRAGVNATDEPLVFLGADDLEFRAGWLEAATARIAGGASVVGVNDLIPRRRQRRGHATHFLMTRAYANLPTIDGAPGPLSGAYDHNFVDDELIATATSRGVYAYAADSHVRHDHPMTGGQDDDTYRKGRAGFHADRTIFQGREHLWT